MKGNGSNNECSYLTWSGHLTLTDCRDIEAG